MIACSTPPPVSCKIFPIHIFPALTVFISHSVLTSLWRETFHKATLLARVFHTDWMRTMGFLIVAKIQCNFILLCPLEKTGADMIRGWWGGFIDARVIFLPLVDERELAHPVNEKNNSYMWTQKLNTISYVANTKICPEIVCPYLLC